MKVKEIIKVLPVAFLLFSCGGEELTLDSVSSDGEESISEVKFGSTNGDCSGTKSITVNTEKANLGIADAITGDDYSTFTYQGGEITKQFDRVSIVVSNSKDNTAPTYNSLKPNDVLLILSIKANDGEVKAGELTSDNYKIGLRRGEKVDGTVLTAPYSSSSDVAKVTLNEVSKGHVCGSYTLTSEEGDVLVEFSFDTDIFVSMW